MFVWLTFEHYSYITLQPYLKLLLNILPISFCSRSHKIEFTLHMQNSQFLGFQPMSIDLVVICSHRFPCLNFFLHTFWNWSDLSHNKFGLSPKVLQLHFHQIHQLNAPCLNVKFISPSSRKAHNHLSCNSQLTWSVWCDSNPTLLPSSCLAW